jgi:tetratricopeptide (TPR) repeat protein
VVFLIPGQSGEEVILAMAEEQKQDIDGLLTAIRPMFPADQQYIVEAARGNAVARFSIAMALVDSGKKEYVKKLLDSVVSMQESAEPDTERARVRAYIELAMLDMDELKYDLAEDYLWEASNRYTSEMEDELSKEDISLWIAQCRFGQGFVQEAIDKAEEILRKQRKIAASDAQLAKTYQQLGWFYLHKVDVPKALDYMERAMKLAPQLLFHEVNLGKEAQKQGDFEKAVQHYFDAIVLE